MAGAEVPLDPLFALTVGEVLNRPLQFQREIAHVTRAFLRHVEDEAHQGAMAMTADRRRGACTVTYSLHQHVSSGRWILAEVRADGIPEPLPDSYPDRASAVAALQAQAEVDWCAGLTVRALHRPDEPDPLRETVAAGPADAPWIVAEGDDEAAFVSFAAAKRECKRRGGQAQLLHRDFGPVPSIRMSASAAREWIEERRRHHDR